MVAYDFDNRSPSFNSPNEYVEIDRNHGIKHTLYQLDRILKKNIRYMTGVTGNPYKGLVVKCNDETQECNYSFNTKGIVIDGSCLFDSLLYVLQKKQTHDNRVTLRNEIVRYYSDAVGRAVNVGHLDPKSPVPDDYVRSFVDIYSKNVIIFSIDPEGNFSATIHFKTILTEAEFTIDFLIVMGGHFTTLTKKKRHDSRFVNIVLNTDFGMGKIKDFINKGEISNFEDRILSFPLGTIDEFAQLFQFPDNNARPENVEPPIAEPRRTPQRRSKPVPRGTRWIRVTKKENAKTNAKRNAKPNNVSNSKRNVSSSSNSKPTRGPTRKPAPKPRGKVKSRTKE